MGTTVVGSAVEAHAVALAARCAVLLGTIARQGGPEPAEHLAEVRRLLARRPGRLTDERRRQLRAALTAAERGTPHPFAADHVTALVRDLEAIEHVLLHVARVGAPTSPPVPA